MHGITGRDANTLTRRHLAGVCCNDFWLRWDSIGFSELMRYDFENEEYINM